MSVLPTRLILATFSTLVAVFSAPGTAHASAPVAVDDCYYTKVGADTGMVFYYRKRAV